MMQHQTMESGQETQNKHVLQANSIASWWHFESFLQGKKQEEEVEVQDLASISFAFRICFFLKEIRKKPGFRWYYTALYRKKEQLNKEIPKPLIFCKPYHQPPFFGSWLSSFFTSFRPSFLSFLLFILCWNMPRNTFHMLYNSLKCLVVNRLTTRYHQI